MEVLQWIGEGVDTMGQGGPWAAYYCFTLFGTQMRDFYPYPNNTLIVVHHIAVMVSRHTYRSP